ncbi:MAG: c-type cytochrome domain-containing protein, partial [Planctomycetota bacterium]|nr:c-type cytochrome domain-containing protein [Planctomycetota bacterium]
MNPTFDCSLPRLVFILAITLFPLGPTLSAAPLETLTFEADIRPIFREHCFDCHGATNDFEGGLDLRQVRRQILGGDSGPAIVPGDAEDSFLIQRIQ